MLRSSAEGEYEERSEGGVRHLFKLGPYEFHDTLDADETYHHYILESGDGGRGYEVDRETMYEFMARFLAGLYELEEYDLDQSPTHHSLLDMLEIATARARGGETDFSWDEFDRVENELMDEEEDDGGGDDGDGEDGPAR